MISKFFIMIILTNVRYTYTLYKLKLVYSNSELLSTESEFVILSPYAPIDKVELNLLLQIEKEKIM